MRPLTLAAAALLIGSAAAAAQIGQSGTLTGRVTDARGAGLPDVTITASASVLPGGAQSTVTNAAGAYVFAALPPGSYEIKAERAGYRTTAQEDVALHIGQTAAVNITLQAGDPHEAAAGPRVSPLDARSPIAASHLTTALLENVPFESRRAFDAVLLAPGVGPSDATAYGTAGSFWNAYAIDGVDAADPETGAPRTFASYNWLQDLRTTPGADAEFGGFTGIAAQGLLRSGGSRFSGLVETLFTNDALQGNNVSAGRLQQNARLAPPALDYDTTNSIQAGGPIHRDRAWFFAGIDYHRAQSVPAGYPAPPPLSYKESGTGPRSRREQDARGIFKPTVAVERSSRLTGFAIAGKHAVDGFGAAADRATEATLHRSSPDVSWNTNYTRVLSSSSVFDVQYSGFKAKDDLIPYNGSATPGWYDLVEEFYSSNADYFSSSTSARHQLAGRMTKYVSARLQHGLEAGVELERSPVKHTFGYPGGFHVLAYAGVPGFGEFWNGYSKDDVNGRVAIFAQDAWTFHPRLTMSGGVRYVRITGENRHLGDRVFASGALAPRIGLAWDVGGNSRTIVRGQYGWYFDGARSAVYDLVDPEIHPQHSAPIDANLRVAGVMAIERPGTNRAIDGGIRLPRMKQAAGTIEHELGRLMTVGVTGLYRDYDRLIDDVLVARPSDFVTSVVRDPGPDGLPTTGDETSNTVTVSRQLTDPLRDQYLITNPAGAVRRYRGLELTVNRHMSGRWQMQASWVISKTTGNSDNLLAAPDSAEYDDPNTNAAVQPFRTGRLTSDHTHLAKVLGTYRVPWNVLVSGAFFYTTGQTYTRTVRSPRVPQGRVDVFIEPRGRERLDDQPRLDLRIEKQFSMRGTNRLGIAVEGFNVLNNAAVTAVTSRSGSLYGRPLAIVEPRRLRVGGVYRF